MNHLNKGKAKYISVLTLALLLFTITLYGSADIFYCSDFHSILTTDTIPLKNAGNINKDSLSRKKNNNTADTNIVVKTDTLIFQSSNSSLDAPVVYHADDSLVMDIPAKKMILYGKTTRVTYQDNILVSPRIEFDQKTNMVSAYLVKDSNGNVIAYPEFTQGDLKTRSDSIRFSPKTGKGITKGTYTQQDEIFIYAGKIKKVDPDVFYAFKGRFTTCNLDTPHFSFVSNRIKFINKKMAISGPVHPEFENVPIPVILPFGIFPLSHGRHSGILAPTFTANADLGLALEGL